MTAGLPVLTRGSALGSEENSLISEEGFVVVAISQPDRLSILQASRLPKGKRLKTILSMQLYPLWELIPIVREHVKKVLSLLVKNNNIIDRITIAVSELLENGVKYASSGLVFLSLAYADDPSRLVIKVANKSNLHHAQVLKQFKTAMGKKDQQTFYMQSLKQKHRQHGMSQKGLARINYETGGRLKLTVTADQSVQMEVLFLI